MHIGVIELIHIPVVYGCWWAQESYWNTESQIMLLAPHADRLSQFENAMEEDQEGWTAWTGSELVNAHCQINQRSPSPSFTIIDTKPVTQPKSRILKYKYFQIRCDNASLQTRIKAIKMNMYSWSRKTGAKETTKSPHPKRAKVDYQKPDH